MAQGLGRAHRAGDALLCPTMATPPIVASKAERAEPDLPDDGRYRSEDMTGVFNLVAPCPALTVPCGWHTGDGIEGLLRIGLQIDRPALARRHGAAHRTGGRARAAAHRGAPAPDLSPALEAAGAGRGQAPQLKVCL
ncbi:MAG: hypothetical protein V9E82_03330 [Candidatus Nanopelagicales bacterium]